MKIYCHINITIQPDKVTIYRHSDFLLKRLQPLQFLRVWCK
jgi:hypothetical protein